jgi:hypothetical protein
MRLIREAVKCGTLGKQFKPAAVNKAVGITYAGVFLPKHRIGNPGFRGKRFKEHFIQLERGLYQLK